MSGSLEVRPRRAAVALLFSLALIPPWLEPSSAVAQDRGPVVRGVVRDEAGRPIEGAEVQLYGSPRRTAVTGPDGAFRVAGLRNARYWLLVRRIGFLPHQESLTLAGDETREVTVPLQAAPVRLPDVVAKAQRSLYDRRMQDFMWRSRSAFGGRFLTRDDVERARPARLGDLVVRYLPFKRSWVMDEPGGWIYDGIAGTGYDVTRLTRFRRFLPDCPPGVALNGGPVSAGLAVNDFRPDDIEALEIYREGSDLPIEYSSAGRTRCGLVVIWLRSYAQVSAER